VNAVIIVLLLSQPALDNALDKYALDKRLRKGGSVL
jgi:hypothetical protein